MIDSLIGLLRQGEWVALGYLANAVWQVPLVFAAAWIAAKLARRTGSALEHRVWVLALLLEALLPAAHLDLRAGWEWMTALFSRRSGAHEGAVGLVVGAGAVNGDGLRLPSFLLVGLASIFAATVVYFVARLAWGAWRTESMRRRALPLVLEGEAARAWRRCGGLAPVVELRVSGVVSGPVTVGISQPAVLVPVGFLESVESSDLEAVLAHELAHVRRWDFAKNLLYEAISVAVAWHPVVWMTRARVAESREMVCDAMAAEAVAGNENYARSLLRLAAMVADGSPAKTLHAIGIFDANSFERRVMNLTKKPVEMRIMQRVGTVAACAVMVVATCAAALALRVEVGPEMQAVAAAGGADPLKVDQGKLTHTSQKMPVYPAEAKAKKDTINGPVVLAVTIGKDGAVEQISVKKSLRADYDRSALDAVKDWRWQPYLLNGEPVEVDTTVTVTYSLGDDSEGEPLIQKVTASAQGTPNHLPKIIGQVDPEYPAQGRVDKVNGTVVVGVTVGSDGAVKETHIVDSLRDDFDESAQKAVRQYRFEPALADGKPVEAKVQVQVDFRIY
ncbi:TonB family protein [Granulicella aggregans]|uniref:TonB family protein n=1 Tax=Granulicella aggregans TaxID=474949 RepID=A0A7W7Z9G2_9BACT|nr:M56 family metallopeptidase [Granulicella aggregans]MBB5055791.1 TonB family protein [Granulicella aggregans]